MKFMFAAGLMACGLGAQPLVNPLLPSGLDPWVTSLAAFYYYVHTTGSNLTIWCAEKRPDRLTISGIGILIHFCSGM